MFTLIILTLAFAAGFIYAAGASNRARKAIGSGEPQKLSREQKLVAAAIRADDQFGAIRKRAAISAERTGLKLAAGAANGAGLAAQALSRRLAERARREQALY